MTYFEDLSDCTYLRLKGLTAVAVGWLDPRHPWRSADEGVTVGEALVDRLDQLALVKQPKLGRCAGFHSCEFTPPCPTREQRIADARLNWTPVWRGRRLGSGFVFVPHRDSTKIYCTPDLILHYIVVHRYHPPEEFLEAVARARPKMCLQSSGVRGTPSPKTSESRPLSSPNFTLPR